MLNLKASTVAASAATSICLGALLSQVTACKSVGGYKPYQGNAPSTLTDVAVNLPDRQQMVDEVSNITDLMNGVHLQVVHIGECSQPSALDKVTAYEDAVTINMALKQGCSYEVLLGLGQLPGGTNPTQLAKTYYSNSKPHKIAAADIAGKSKINTKITLNLQSDGRAIGLGKVETSTVGSDEVGAGVTFANYADGQPTSVNPGVSNVPTWRVFQQDSSAKGSIDLKFGNLGNDARFARVRLVKDSSPSEVLDGWQTFDLKEGNGESQSITYRGKAGGWYKVEILIHDDSGKVLGRQLLDKVGIGEVFVVAGQSNSTNCGSVRTQSQTGMVASTDGSRWQKGDDPMIGTNDNCTGGSSWPSAGDVLAESLKVPVAFASTGRSGTAVSQWLPDSTDNLLAYTDARIKQLGHKGFRALLWHQGETDVANESTEQIYYDRLKTVIDTSRSNAGWQFPWLVAEAAWCRQIQQYNKPAFERQVLAAQRRLAASLDYVLPGPNTDRFTTGYRSTNCHFNEAGAKATGAEWATKISQLYAD